MFGMSRKRLIWFCHGAATMLDAGLPVIRVLEVLSGQAPGRTGAKIAAMKRSVEAGDNLTEAAEKQHMFPPLFLQLVSVGEESGTLERTMAELARYFEFQQRLWRSFLSRVTLPAVQYIVAVVVISFATYIINSLQHRPGGFAGVMVPGYGIPLAIIFAYVFLLKPMGATRVVHEALLQVPILGSVTRTLALARFSLVMQLLQESATPIGRALERATEATNNAAFAARGKRMAAAVEGGANLTEALEHTGLFPREYIEVVRIAEESGKMSERFGWLAAENAQKAETALQALGTALAWLVWAVVAAFIISFIFRIFMQYVGTINSLTR